MPLSLNKKKLIVENLKELANKSKSLVLADFSSLPVSTINKVRRSGFDKDVKIFVLHNRLTHRALKDTPYEFLVSHLTGPCLCAFSLSHPRDGALILKNVANEINKHILKGAAFEGQYLDSKNGVDWLSKIPTKEEAMANLLCVIKEAMIGKFARTLLSLKNNIETKC